MGARKLAAAEAGRCSLGDVPPESPGRRRGDGQFLSNRLVAIRFLVEVGLGMM
jgi:hypothetical protein